MNELCDYCKNSAKYVIRCSHGITCHTYATCATHLSRAVNKTYKDGHSSARVDKE